MTDTKTVAEWVRIAKERAPERCGFCNKVMIRGEDVGYDPRIKGCDACQAKVLAIHLFALAELEGRLT